MYQIKGGERAGAIKVLRRVNNRIQCINLVWILIHTNRPYTDTQEQSGLWVGKMQEIINRVRCDMGFGYKGKCSFFRDTR